MKEYKFKISELVGTVFTVLADSEEEAWEKLPTTDVLPIHSSYASHAEQIKDDVHRQVNPKAVLDLDGAELVSVNDPDLKRCPFCGKPPVIYLDNICEDYPPYPVVIRCNNEDCPAYECKVKDVSFEKAVSLWNTRVMEASDE